MYKHVLGLIGICHGLLINQIKKSKNIFFEMVGCDWSSDIRQIFIQEFQENFNPKIFHMFLIKNFSRIYNLFLISEN